MNKNNEAREAEAAYNKAMQLELAKNYDDAFRLYIKSAEGFLHLSRSAGAGVSEVQKNKWKAAANRALDRAEKIKSVADKHRVARGVAGATEHLSTGADAAAAAGGMGALRTGEIRLTPVTVNPFSPYEQFLVLKKGERINGLVFPPWDDPITPQPPTSVGPAGYHAVIDQPHLSREQVCQNAEWRRPPPDSVVVPQRQVLPQEIVQHTSDCSLCASIMMCLEHGRRFKSQASATTIRFPTPLLQLVQGALHPCQEHGSAGLSCGRYYVRILWNGIWRRIVIDDKLPYSLTTNELLCMSVLPHQRAASPDSRTVLWPSLIEKAYMKLLGGYEFPGSISSLDLYALIGWVPEHINTKSPGFEREKTWARMLHGFSNGQCVVAVGSGPKERCVWRGKRLLPEHCYPVIDISEDSDGPTVTILDSWTREEHLSKSRHMRFPWSDVISTFDGVFISWNPAIWPRNIKFHGMWNLGQSEQSTTSSLRLNFCNVTPDSSILVLLTRHVVDTNWTSHFISLRAELDDEMSSVAGPTVQETLTEKGTFTNNVQILTKARVSSSSGALCITASYDGDGSEVGYTIDVYASQLAASLSWDENVSPPPYSEIVTGSFTTKNSGGNGTYPTFMLNPQYHLHIRPPRAGSRLVSVPNQSHQKVKTMMVLKTERSIPVNISLAWSQGMRVYVLSEKELAASSGPYSYGLATITEDLAPGDYSLVISAFEPRHLGSFSLSVSSSSPFDLRPIPQEGAGMYQKVIKGEWTAENAGGSPGYDKYASNPVYLIESPSQFRLKLRLQLTQPSKTASLNVTIFPAPTLSSAIPNIQDFKQRHVATSGAYDDAICGVATQQVSLSAGKYWVVPSTYIPGVKAEYNLVVYASTRDVVVERVR